MKLFFIIVSTIFCISIDAMELPPRSENKELKKQTFYPDPIAYPTILEKFKATGDGRWGNFIGMNLTPIVNALCLQGKRINLCDANCMNSNLKNAVLHGALLVGTFLNGSDLRNANLDGANLEGAYICNGANMSGASCVNANMKNIKIWNSNAELGDFSGSNLKKAELGFSNFKHGYFNGSNLLGVVATQSNFDQTLAFGATMHNNSFKDAKNMPLTILSDSEIKNYNAERAKAKKKFLLALK